MADDATTTIDRDISIGQTEHLYLLSVALGTSYPAGGYTLNPAANTRFERVIGGTPSGYSLEFIPSSQKLKIYRQKDPGNAGGADIPAPEVAAAVDLSVTPGTIYLTAIGA